MKAELQLEAEIKPLVQFGPINVKQGTVVVAQVASNIQKNLSIASDQELAEALNKLADAVKDLGLHQEQLLESLELLEELTEQAKRPPDVRKLGVINGCLQRFRTILEGANKYSGIAGLVLQVAGLFDSVWQNKSTDFGSLKIQNP